MTRTDDGLLVAICGLDGSGKSTQAALLAQRLAGIRPSTVLRPVTDLFRQDPVVRSYLETGDPAASLDVLAEFALLGAADRLRQYRTEVAPRLRRGEVVIMDRYVLSSYAWARARGLTDLPWLRSLNRHIPEPDLTICLDVTPAEAARRILARGDQLRWEERDEPRLERARMAFARDCAPATNFRVLDGSLAVEVIAEQIFQLVQALVRTPATLG